ncbi:MAG TPA: hypothetical protein PLB89_17175 [Flavobacteriales bacterium]|nr:hypothetical protein [Flavobacteriales bacterium]
MGNNGRCVPDACSRLNAGQHHSDLYLRAQDPYRTYVIRFTDMEGTCYERVVVE